VEKAVSYIVSCKNLDGGFGCTPGGESHAGQSMLFIQLIIFKFYLSKKKKKNYMKFYFLISLDKSSVCVTSITFVVSCLFYQCGKPVQILRHLFTSLFLSGWKICSDSESIKNKMCLAFAQKILAHFLDSITVN
jgi:hypothetical protein